VSTSLRNLFKRHRHSFNPESLLRDLKNNKEKKNLFDKVKEMEEARKSEVLEPERNNYPQCKVDLVAQVQQEIEEENIPNEPADDIQEVSVHADCPTIEIDEWTTEDLVRTIQKSKEAIKHIMQNYEFWNSMVKECDQALGDLRHFAEFYDDATQEEINKVYELMTEYSRKRRVYKDRVEIFKDVFASKARMENIYAPINQMSNKFNKMNIERQYSPRVLKDLFER
jgi:hypothetical protein